MKRSQIDFIHEKEASSMLSTLMLAIGVAALLGSAITWMWSEQQELMALDALETQQALANTRTQQAERAEAAILAQQSFANDKRWKASAHQLRTPWFAVLGVLEEVAQPPAYILSARLDPARDAVELEVVAPKFDDALLMLDNLQQQGAVSEPRLVTREAPQPSTSPSPSIADMRFVIQAAWRHPQ